MKSGLRLSPEAIIGSFYQRLNVATTASWVPMLGMLFSSSQEAQEYRWLGNTPTMREWIGGRHAKGFRANGIIIRNKKFEATMEIDVDEIRRDGTGQIMVRIDELVTRTVTHWQSLMSTLILGGESGICYDGQYFFDTDHAEGDSGSQSNDITVDISGVPATVHGTATAPSAEEMRAMILAGAQQMLGLNDDQGEPMNEMARQFLVQVPTAWFSTAAAAISNPVVGGDTNVLTNLDGFAFALAVNPRLTWTDKLAVFRTDGSVKPFILQEEEGVTVSAVAEGSELEFNEGMHHYGVKALRNVGYGYWQHACLVQAI